MLSLNAGRRDLFLPKCNVPDFVDSPIRALTNLEEWMEGRLEGSKGEQD